MAATSSKTEIRPLTFGNNGHRTYHHHHSNNTNSFRRMIPNNNAISKSNHNNNRNRPNDDDEKCIPNTKKISKSKTLKSSIAAAPSQNMRKIKKFVRCSKKIHLNLRTTTNTENGKLEIEICKGALPPDQLLYIKQHCQYQVRYNDHEQRQNILLASIPKHFECRFSFKSIVSFTHYIVNNKFIRFRNRGPTQTKAVSLWRIYEFEGEQTLFNIWIVMKAAERSLNLKSCANNTKHSRSYSGCGNETMHISKKNKNYHLAAYQSVEYCVDGLGEDVIKHIFGYLTGSKYHCWIHIHEVIDCMHHRSNLIGLEFDSNSRNIYVMQRSPALLKKVRQIGDKYYTKKDGVNGNSVLTESFFKKSVEMFHAVY